MGSSETYTASEARSNFSEIISKAIYNGPVVITRGRDAVAVVPLELLNKLAEIEAQNDENLAEEAMDEYNKKGGKRFS